MTQTDCTILDLEGYKCCPKVHHGAHLWRSTSIVHSQGSRQGTADYVGLKEGSQEIAAAQSQRVLPEDTQKHVYKMKWGTCFKAVGDIFQPGWGPNYIHA